MKGVSVIVINWNGKQFLSHCLTSVLDQTYRDLDLLVIDSGSSDGSPEFLRKEFSGVRVIAKVENLGYSRAFNLGLKMTEGKYVLLLNADTYLDHLFIEKAVSAMDHNLALGSLSGKILRFDRRTLDSAGQFLGRDRRPLDRGYNEGDKGQYDDEAVELSVCGAVAFYRRKMLEECALLGESYDEDYFAFYEDLDLGWRANLLGWKSLYFPKSVAYHFRWGTGGFKGFKGRYGFLKRPLELKVHLLKNRYLTIIKNDHLRGILKDLPQILQFEGKLWAGILLFSPSLLFLLPSFLPYFIRAFQKRQILHKKMRGKR